MLVQCRAGVADAGPALNQHRVDFEKIVGLIVDKIDINK